MIVARKLDRAAVAQMLTTFADCVFEPGDVVEVRRLDGGSPVSEWTTADALHRWAGPLCEHNDAGRNIYIGANPRKTKGGKSAADVALARCLFADFDDTADVEIVRGRIEGAGLPVPTLIAHSGHGLHCYWRLIEPLHDLPRWCELQKWLIAGLNSDAKIKDLPRIMRLPGFINKKSDKPWAESYIFDSDPQRRYPVEILAKALEQFRPKPSTASAPVNHHQRNDHVDHVRRAQAYVGKLPPAISGQGGHDATYHAACCCIRFNCTEEETFAILRDVFNPTCQPPWSEHELRHKAASAWQTVPEGERGSMLNKDNRVPICSDDPGDDDNDDNDDAPNELPRINAGLNDLAKITKRAWDSIQWTNDPPTIFRYSGMPARIETGDDGSIIIRNLDETRLRHLVARTAEWVTYKKMPDGTLRVRPAFPPMAIVSDMLATPDQPLPVLTRIVEAPVFASDGTLQTSPGYHDRSATYYVPHKALTVPDVPTRPSGLDIETAAAFISDELLGDFPFVGDSERAHAIALLLLPFARDLIDGPTPLHLIEKPSPGTGATLMIDLLALPATGRQVAILTEGRDEDEWRKRLTSKLRSSPTMVLIDNLRRRLDSAAVSAAITAQTWEDRLLGASDILRIPVRCAWVATGNNPAVSSEISRRTVRIRLDARIDRPWLREGFKHHDIRAWAIENRGMLIWSALTLIQAWIAAGKPAGNRKLGMFEHWSAVMGGILDVARIPGFLANLEDFYNDSDAEGQSWRGFIAAWWDEYADAQVKVSDLWRIVTTEACLSLGDGGEQSQKIFLGRMLAEKRDRMFDIDLDGTPRQVRIERAGERRRATLWKLRIEGVSV